MKVIFWGQEGLDVQKAIGSLPKDLSAKFFHDLEAVYQEISGDEFCVLFIDFDADSNLISEINKKITSEFPHVKRVLFTQKHSRQEIIKHQKGSDAADGYLLLPSEPGLVKEIVQSLKMAFMSSNAKGPQPLRGGTIEFVLEDGTLAKADFEQDKVADEPPSTEELNIDFVNATLQKHNVSTSNESDLPPPFEDTANRRIQAIFDSVFKENKGFNEQSLVMDQESETAASSEVNVQDIEFTSPEGVQPLELDNTAEMPTDSSTSEEESIEVGRENPAAPRASSEDSTGELEFQVLDTENSVNMGSEELTESASAEEGEQSMAKAQKKGPEQPIENAPEAVEQNDQAESVGDISLGSYATLEIEKGNLNTEESSPEAQGEVTLNSIDLQAESAAQAKNTNEVEEGELEFAVNTGDINPEQVQATEASSHAESELESSSGTSSDLNLEIPSSQNSLDDLESRAPKEGTDFMTSFEPQQDLGESTSVLSSLDLAALQGPPESSHEESSAPSSLEFTSSRQVEDGELNQVGSESPVATDNVVTSLDLGITHNDGFSVDVPSPPESPSDEHTPTFSTVESSTDLDALQAKEGAVDDLGVGTENAQVNYRAFSTYKKEHDSIVAQHDQELVKLSATIRNLREDRQKLLDKIAQLEQDKEDLKAENHQMKAELDEVKIEHTLYKKRAKEEKELVSYELGINEQKRGALEEKNRLLQLEIEKLKQRLHLDIGKVKQKEKELESRLELLKTDSESQIRNRENKIIELKRKIDGLEFDMENMSKIEKRTKDSTLVLEERLDRVMKTLRMAMKMLEESEGGTDKTEIFKKLKF